EPTNNIAERALRELIVIRKIIGGLRRETGARTMETIASMFATWKQQGKPLYPTLKKAISG
ncbi:MAG: transposase, partial [Candidatus Diapherotrites archaeon]